MDQLGKLRKKYRLRQGDEVIVLVGKSRGERGTIESIDRRTDRVFVSGVNMYVKHQRPDETGGGIQEKAMPVHISNLALVDPQTGGPTRVGYREDADQPGTKVRFARKSGAQITG